MVNTESEKWTASSDGTPWTHVVGSRDNAEKVAKEMRKDGFSGVLVEKYERIDTERPKVKP